MIRGVIRRLRLNLDTFHQSRAEFICDFDAVFLEGEFGLVGRTVREGDVDRGRGLS